MPLVSGILKVGEAQGATRAIARRQRGSEYTYLFVLFGLMIVGAFLGNEIGSRFEPSGSLFGMGIGIFAGALAYNTFCKKFLLVRFRKRLADRAIPMDLQLSLNVTSDALLYTVGEVEQSAKWNVVTDIFRSHGYWIFLVQGAPWFAPERLFANGEEEKAFFRSAVQCMTEQARQRSPDATSFAEA